MNLKIKYALAIAFWIMSLIWGWQLNHTKGYHWLIFAMWVAIMTIAFVWLLKEFKSRNR